MKKLRKWKRKWEGMVTTVALLKKSPNNTFRAKIGPFLIQKQQNANAKKHTKQSMNTI